MSNHNVDLGKWGEAEASKYIQSKGYSIRENNYRTEYGEIDLIAEKGGELIFIEVKTRSGGKFGNPEEAITPIKMAHMIDSASAYFQEHPEIECDWRIDVIAILLKNQEQATEILHFENAIQG